MTPDSSAHRLYHLNREVISLLSLGIEIDLGLGSDPVVALRDINDRLASLASDSLEPFLQDPSLPKKYRSVARMLLAADDPAPIIQSIATHEEQRKMASTPVSQALVEPFVVFFFGYLGMLLLCYFVLPQIENQFENQWQEPGLVTGMLLAIRDWMPVWAIVIPFVFVAALVMTLRSSIRLDRLLPGSRRRRRWVSSLGQARRLGALTESDVDTETALQLAQHDGDEIGAFTRSLLRDQQPQVRAAGLRRLISFYRSLVHEPSANAGRGAASSVGILLGGVIVLGFSLVLFLPWIEVLHGVVIPGGRP
ncbi:MAG: hypothetical protein AAFU85_06445 [Planctomycetota bacterium]